MDPIELAVPDISAQIEEKVNADVPFAIPGVDFTKLPSEFITLLNLIVKADRRNIYTAQADLDTKKDADHAAYKAQAEQRIGDLTQRMGEQTQAYNDLEQELLEVRTELANEITARQHEVAAKVQAIAERDEARTNRDNAAAQLDEARKEIDRLNSLVDDYQKAKVFGEREAQQVIEVVTEASEATEINEAIQKLYTSFENYGNINKVTKPDGSTELVKSDALMNEWTKAPAGGSESADSFRDETAEAITENGGLPDTETTITPPPFPDTHAEDLAEDPAGAGDATIPTVVEQPVSREEFEALKQRVTLLEQVNTGAAA